MSEMTIADLLNLASDIGVIALLIVTIYGGAQGWYLWRQQHDDEIDTLKNAHEREMTIIKAAHDIQVTYLTQQLAITRANEERWMNAALENTGILKRLVDVTEKSVQ